MRKRRVVCLPSAERDLVGELEYIDRLVALGCRILAIGEHLAFYVVLADRVEVRRVPHGKGRYSFLL